MAKDYEYKSITEIESLQKKKELFGIMNETVKTKFVIVKLLKGNKFLYMTDVESTGVDKGTVGWDKGKAARFFDTRYEAEKLVCLILAKGNANAFVMEIPDYHNLENFHN